VKTAFPLLIEIPQLGLGFRRITLLTDQQTEVTLRVNEMTAAVQLIQALGDGWDTNQLPAADEVTARKVIDRLEHP
jgi:hypothetical protein